MKILKSAFIATILLMFGCSKPAPVEIKDVCQQSEGAKVIIQGYISLPANY